MKRILDRRYKTESDGFLNISGNNNVIWMEIIPGGQTDNS